MSESEKGHGGAKMETAERERHEKVVGEVVERLRTLGFVRAGESLGWSFPTDPEKQKWSVRVETGVLGDAAAVEERKKQFPDTPDIVYALLKEAGYRVDVDYDYERSDSKMDYLNYNLYEEKK